MKKLTPVEMTECEKEAVAKAAETIGAVLARFESANAAGFAFSPLVQLTVRRRDDFATPHGQRKTESSFMLDMTGVGHAYGATLGQALGNLFGLTDAEKKRRQAALCRADAERLEREAAALDPRETALAGTEGGAQ